MCGIAGIIDISRSEKIKESDICGMCDAIIHRGPDDYGTYVDRHTGIGMRRLSIIDVKGGHQPLSNEDDTVWIVFNGEIYNHSELRDLLLSKGHKFTTKTDTETIVHLYEQYGIECVKHLRGMFAFIIWDARNERYFVARDRLGIKPCFWSQNGSKIAIGSEIKALLTLPWIKRSIDWNGFDAFFTYTYIPSPLTIYNDIKKLPPAHYLLVENGKLEIKRYWDLSFADKLELPEAKIEEDFLSLLHESVNIRLMSEVPLGAFLSGGIDSGLIVALMSKDFTGHKTFTVNFEGSKGDFLDERPFALEIAEKYACQHHEVGVLPRIEEAIEAAIFSFDEPFADDGLIPTHHICKACKNDLTVILTGLGGDENFAGYERHLGFWLSRFTDQIPGLIWSNILTPVINLFKEQKNGHYRINHLKRFIAAGNLPPAERYQGYIRTMAPEKRRRLYHNDIAEKVDFEYVEWLGRAHFERLDHGDHFDRALYQDLCMYLPDDILALSDRVGMYHSLELRVPFVDHKLVEFCAKLPSKLKIRNGKKKYLLKKAGKRLLPNSVISHRKQGFCSPMSSWLSGDLLKTVENKLSDDEISKDNIFNKSTVRELISSHYERNQMNDKLIFSLMLFQDWYNK